MVKLIAILLSIQLVLLPVITLADETPKAALLVKGQLVPFDGLLLNPVAQAKILASKITAARECKSQLKYLSARKKAECKKKLDLLVSKSSITEKKLNSLLVLKDKEIEEIQAIALKAKKPCNVPLWTALGAAGGIALTIGVFFIVKESSK